MGLLRRCVSVASGYTVLDTFMDSVAFEWGDAGSFGESFTQPGTREGGRLCKLGGRCELGNDRCVAVQRQRNGFGELRPTLSRIGKCLS